MKFKILVSWFVAFFLVVGMVSAAYISHYGVITGTADVEISPEWVGWWKLDGGSGKTALDNSSYGNNGTIHGANWTSLGSSAALEFDGEDDYVEVADSPSLNVDQEVTISAWVFLQSSTYHAVVSRKQQKHSSRFLILGSDELFYETGSGNYSKSSDTLTKEKWSHIVLTLNEVSDDLEASFYINGNHSGTETILSDSVDWNSTYNLWIGANDLDADYVLNGTIDDVRIFNVSLNQNQVQNDFKNSCGKYGAC